MTASLKDAGFNELVMQFQLALGLGQGHFVLDKSGPTPTFHRPDLSGDMTPTKLWCTGGEYAVRFEASHLRAWLRERAEKTGGDQ